MKGQPGPRPSPPHQQFRGERALGKGQEWGAKGRQLGEGLQGWEGEQWNGAGKKGSAWNAARENRTFN